jgi:hypothetical protein
MAIKITFKTHVMAKQDEWGRYDYVISEESKLNRIKELLETKSDNNPYVPRALIVEHFHYRAGMSATRELIENYDDFIDYLEDSAKAGDAIHVFDVTDALTGDNEIAAGKCPDETGEVPRGGAY